MKHVFVAAVLGLGLALPAQADVTLKQTAGGKGLGISGTASGATYAGFYKAAVEKGWIFSDPRGAKAQPGQAKAMAEMYKQMAGIGGIPYETNVQVKMSGSGPMAGILSKIGNVTMTSTVDSVEVAPLAADLFAPPAGYKLTQKK